jgi:hypothetical protein
MLTTFQHPIAHSATSPLLFPNQRNNTLAAFPKYEEFARKKTGGAPGKARVGPQGPKITLPNSPKEILPTIPPKLVYTTSYVEKKEEETQHRSATMMVTPLSPYFTM